MRYIKILCICFCFLSVVAQAETVDGWEITVQKLQAHQKFLKTVDMEIYTGDTVLKEILHEPQKGFLYITVDCTINRSSSDGILFDSALLTLKTPRKSYTRLTRENDFLSEYDISTFPYLKVKKGNHHGTFLFEIPVSENQNLQLYYKETPLSVAP